MYTVYESQIMEDSSPVNVYKCVSNSVFEITYW